MRAFPNEVPIPLKFKYLQENSARTFVFSYEQEDRPFTELLKLDSAPPPKQGGKGRKKDAHRHHKLFVVLVECGMRLSEALNIRWSDLMLPNLRKADPEGEIEYGLIRLWRAAELKTGRIRTIPITKAWRAALDACLGIPAGPFTDLNKFRASHVWLDAKAKAEIDDGDCVIHSLRHTWATRLLTAFGDIKLVQEWLGHTALVTTSAMYAHVQTSQMVRAAGAINRLRHGT